MPKTKGYNIRQATKEDVIDLTILGKQFVKESQNELLGWNSTKVHYSLLDAIDRDDFAVLVLEHKTEVVGMFIGFIAPCFFSDSLQAAEIVWYIDPKHRGSRIAYEMIDLFEEWAGFREAVCTNLMNLNVLKGDKVAKLYGRMGYKMVENTFTKEL